MKKYLLWAALFFLVAGTGVAPLRAEEPISAKELLDRIDDIWRGRSSKSRFSMRIKTANWERNLTMRNYSLGKDYSLVSIEKPEKEKGTSTLKVHSDIWNYLPKVDRTIKIPPSMLLSAWMGSHFTNDDLVKESRMSEDYDYKITFQGQRDATSIYELTLVPKPNAPVVWGKVVVEVRRQDLMPLRQFYYDEKGVLARTSLFSDFRQMGGKLIPARMRVSPADKPAEFTEVVTEEIAFDVALTADFFSLAQLKRK